MVVSPRFASAVFLVLAAGSARAEPRPPAPRRTPVPEFPRAAEVLGLEASVVLVVSIDATGQVTDAEVVDPVGHGFDEAALDAAYRLEFAPAENDGVPVASRIRFTFRFRLPDASGTPPPSPPAPPEIAAAEPVRRETAIDVTVRGASEADTRRRSAEAVHVVETERAQRESADLAEVLARSQGVAVRRSGGLGSETRFSLNGLRDDQIRHFFDELPLEGSGFVGLQTIPVAFVERIEILRGVMPVRYGADALGGAINVVPERSYRGTRLGFAYESGSYGVHRLAGAASHRDRRGFYSAVSAYVDLAANRYDVEAEVADDRGHITVETVERFHDSFYAAGLRLDAGWFARPWAKQLTFSAHVSDWDKDLQHNVVMTVPYGEVTYGGLNVGGSVRYIQPIGTRLQLSFDGLYAYDQRDFLDVSEWVYDWYGRRTHRRDRPGEINQQPIDQGIWDHRVYLKLQGAFELTDAQRLRLAIVPDISSRGGVDRTTLPGSRDPLDSRRLLGKTVVGLEHELETAGDRLQNIASLKYYRYRADSQEILPGDVPVDRARQVDRVGLAEQLRFRVSDWAWVKASYEWSTRLPDPEEVFGDGALVQANLELDRETSHNANLSGTIDRRRTRLGDWRGDLNFFLRATANQIVLLGNDRNFTYQNVFRARGLGFELAGGWTSPGGLIELDANTTYISYRNVSSEGPFTAFDGDRLPNHPYLFGNAALRLVWQDVSVARDELSLGGYTRYVHEFYRGWESVGIPEFKDTVDTQLSHTLALTYVLRGEQTITTSIEVQNLTDAMTFDTFGAEKPGRAVFFKATVGYAP